MNQSIFFYLYNPTQRAMVQNHFDPGRVFDAIQPKPSRPQIIEVFHTPLSLSRLLDTSATDPSLAGLAKLREKMTSIHGVPSKFLKK